MKAMPRPVRIAADVSRGRGEGRGCQPMRVATRCSTSTARGLERRRSRNSTGSALATDATSSTNDSTAKVLATLPGARMAEVRSGASGIQCTTAFRLGMA
jgi:hypothetical protein